PTLLGQPLRKPFAYNHFPLLLQRFGITRSIFWQRPRRRQLQKPPLGLSQVRLILPLQRRVRQRQLHVVGVVEQRHQPEILGLRDRIVFVVVTLAALIRQPE